jgi:exosortase
MASRCTGKTCLSPLGASASWRRGSILLSGFLLLFAPTYVALFNRYWAGPQEFQGPLVVAVILFLIWHQRALLRQDATDRHVPHAILPATALLGCGLLLLGYGRFSGILALEVLSQILLLAAALGWWLGMHTVRKFWFTLFFMLFLVPLPDMLVKDAEAPLQQLVAEVTVRVLYLFGYPVARSHDLLMIGPYQLVVAGSCSGFHFFLSLLQLGLLYLFLKRYRNRWRIALVLVSIVPIAFVSNIVRVLLLVLLTYHFGDDAVRGMLHGLTGIVLFLFALLVLFAFDALLEHVNAWRSRQNGDTD